MRNQTLECVRRIPLGVYSKYGEIRFLSNGFSLDPSFRKVGTGFRIDEVLRISSPHIFRKPAMILPPPRDILQVKICIRRNPRFCRHAALPAQIDQMSEHIAGGGGQKRGGRVFVDARCDLCRTG